jgi:hypothetical protein
VLRSPTDVVRTQYRHADEPSVRNVVDRSNCPTLGALWAFDQGLLLAAVPQLHVALLWRSCGLHFDDAEADAPDEGTDDD